MAITTGHLKGLFVSEDLSDEGVRVHKEKCYTLQHFSYDCHRSRNENGIPYGATVLSVLHFTVRISDPNTCESFYRQLSSKESIACTFLFNATFNENRILSSYDGAQVVRGFLVDVTEDFQCSSEEQMCMTLGILINRITYLGTDQSKVLSITQ
jgi:hypothetical protein